VWDAETGRELSSFKGAARRVVFSPDGKRLVGPVSKGLKVWDAQTGQELLVLKGLMDRFNTIDFSPEGHRLAVSTEGMVKLYDATPLLEK
jgi:WD40 repeat protein